MIITILVIVIVVWQLMVTPSTSIVETKPGCPPHDWVYNNNERLICTKCGQSPSLIKPDDREF